MRNYTYVSSSLYNTIRNFNNINLFLKLFKFWFVWQLHVNVFIQVIVEFWLLPNKFCPSGKNHLTTKPSYFLCYFNSRWTVDSFNMRAWDDSLRAIQVFYILFSRNFLLLWFKMNTCSNSATINTSNFTN